MRGGLRRCRRDDRRATAGAVAGLVMIIAAGCGSGATTVELAEPLSAEATEQLVGGIRERWSAGGETTADPIPEDETAAPAPGR